MTGTYILATAVGKGADRGRVGIVVDDRELLVLRIFPCAATAAGVEDSSSQQYLQTKRRLQQHNMSTSSHDTMIGG